MRNVELDLEGNLWQLARPHSESTRFHGCQRGEKKFFWRGIDCHRGVVQLTARRTHGSWYRTCGEEEEKLWFLRWWQVQGKREVNSFGNGIDFLEWPSRNSFWKWILFWVAPRRRKSDWRRKVWRKVPGKRAIFRAICGSWGDSVKDERRTWSYKDL